MDFRLIFDSIPEEFDRLRPRYCPALFADVIDHAGLGPGKAALEIGPGTGQATEPVLRSGCAYLAIELGENLAAFMRRRFGGYENFALVNADFETCDFGPRRFDLVYSAQAFQWIKEDVGYPKVYDLLKSGGSFALFSTQTRIADEALAQKIDEAYAAHFHPEIEYTLGLKAMRDLPKYGFVEIEHRQYCGAYEKTAEEFVARTKIMAPLLTVPEPHASRLYAGIREAIESAGGGIMLEDTINLYLARKP